MSPFILVTHGPDKDTVAIMVSAIVSCGKWFGPAADGSSFISHRGGTGNLVVREPFPEILRRIQEATGTVAVKDGPGFSDAVRIARGCLDYCGGHHGNPDLLNAFHHGIQTVINSLESVEASGAMDTQAAALWRMGKKPT